jgi:hypothetical protein
MCPIGRTTENAAQWGRYACPVGTDNLTCRSFGAGVAEMSYRTELGPWYIARVLADADMVVSGQIGEFSPGNLHSRD